MSSSLAVGFITIIIWLVLSEVSGKLIGAAAQRVNDALRSLEKALGPFGPLSGATALFASAGPSA
jgi:hypothetical protein